MQTAVPGLGTINTTAIETKADGMEANRVDDESGTITINGIDSGTSAPCSFGLKVFISDAGQIKAKAQ